MLSNRNFIFSLAMLAGLAFPQASIWTEPLTLPVLALVMTLATTSIPDSFFKSLRPLLVPSAAGIALSYVISGGLTIAMSAWLIDQKDIWIGFVLVALVPPAVAVIPFTSILGGNISYTMAGTVASYLAALIIMPCAFLILLGADFSATPKLTTIMVLLIALPVVLSRIMVKTGIHGRIAPHHGPITNWGFFIVLYTLVGLNQKTIFSDPLMLIPVAAILFVTTFVLGFLIEWIGRRLKIGEKDLVSLVLLGTMKNQGIAGGLALSLFTREAALPSAVSAIFLILFFMWLDIKRRWI
jgi:bile acid:Na+ symporter, BASS family